MKAWDYFLKVILLLCMSQPLMVMAQAKGQYAFKGGAACVMAKWQGNTLDYALVTGKDHPLDAQEAAEQILREKGYDDYMKDSRFKNVDILHSQAVTPLPHAYVIVIKSTYKTARGKDRTSYGCGFSSSSYRDAEWAAVRDMQAYSWGWKPDKDGYELVEQLKY